MNALFVISAMALIFIEFTPYFDTNCISKKLAILSLLIMMIAGA